MEPIANELTLYTEKITQEVLYNKELLQHILNIKEILDEMKFPTLNGGKTLKLYVTKFNSVCKNWNNSIPSRLDLIILSLYTDSIFKNLLSCKKFCENFQFRYIEDHYPDVTILTASSLIIVQQYAKNGLFKGEWISPMLEGVCQCKNPILIENDFPHLSTSSRGRLLYLETLKSLVSNGIIYEENVFDILERTILLPVSLLMQVEEKSIDNQ